MASSSFPSGGGGSPGGSTTQVQVNESGSFGGDAGFTYGGAGNVNISSLDQTISTTFNPSANGNFLVLTGPSDPSLDAVGITFGHKLGSQAAANDWSIFLNDLGTDVNDWSLAERTNFTYKIQAFKGTSGNLLLNQSGGNVGIRNASPNVPLDVTGTVQATTVITATHTPSSAADTGTAGQFAWDASFIYICTSTNTWKRVAIATW